MRKYIILIVATLVLVGCGTGEDSEPVEKENEDKQQVEEVEKDNDKKKNTEKKESKKDDEAIDATSWVKGKSKSVMNVEQYEDRMFIDIDGESGWSISSSVKDAFNTFMWLKEIYKDESVNRVTFQYKYTFTDGEKKLGYSYAYERDNYKKNYETVFEDGDIKPYLVFKHANEYDFHLDVWNETPSDLRQGLDNEPTKIEN